MGAMLRLPPRQTATEWPGHGPARPLARPARPVHNLQAEGKSRNIARRAADTRRPEQRDIQKPDP